MSGPSLAEQVQRSPLGPVVRSVVSRARVPRWRMSGRPAPAPPHRKVATVRSLVEQLRPATFVETGTYRGDTVAAVAPLVQRVVSIELHPVLATLARARFVDRPEVEILEGDSATLLPGVVAGLDRPAVFWLDGHYSGGVTAGDGACPVLAEVRAVLGSDVGHHVLIDDARLFDGSDGYPTLDELRALVEELRPGTPWELDDDIVRLGC